MREEGADGATDGESDERDEEEQADEGTEEGATTHVLAEVTAVRRLDVGLAGSVDLDERQAGELDDEVLLQVQHLVVRRVGVRLVLVRDDDQLRHGTPPGTDGSSMRPAPGVRPVGAIVTPRFPGRITRPG